MPHPLAFPTLAALTAAGVVSGIYLGRSAIAEIDPIYYNEPETRFHADLVPNPPGFDAAPVHEAGYPSPSDTYAALGSGCVNCRDYPEDLYPVHDSSVDKYQPGYAEMIEAPEPEPASYAPDPQEEAERAADFATIQLYAGEPAAAGEESGEPAVVAEVELASTEGELTE